MTRDEFEEVLGAMARADLISFADAVFEKQGKKIPYRTVSLLPGAANFDEQAARFVMRNPPAPALPGKRGKVRAASPGQGKLPKVGAEAPPSERQARLETALRAWRLSEAKRRKMPAFRIFGDRTLRNIASSFPQTDSALLAVPGIGMGTVEKYGAQIYHLVASAD